MAENEKTMVEISVAELEELRARAAEVSRATAGGQKSRRYSDEQIRGMRKLFGAGVPKARIAEGYRLSNMFLSHVLKRESYADVAVSGDCAWPDGSKLDQAVLKDAAKAVSQLKMHPAPKK